MAKIIACPTCGENVEIPPGSAGQVVKCSACGTAIKLVSRKKPVSGSSPGASNADTMSSTGTFAGSYTAPPNTPNWGSDDPPSLGECAQCGSVLADPSQLIEDRGRLICPNCAAKSPVSQREDVHSYRPRPGNADAAPTIGFKEPETIVARHGPFISFDLMTIGGTFAGAIAIGATIWLTFHPEPKGTKDLSVKPIPVINVPPPVSATTDFSEDEKRQISEALVRASDLEKQGESAESLNAALDAYKEVTTTVGAKVLSDPALRDGIDTARARIPALEKRIAELAAPATTIAKIDVPPPTTPLEPPAPATVPAPTTVPEDPPKPAFIFAESAEDVFDTTELLSLGMHALKTYNYELARDSFLKAQKQLGGRDGNEQYQPEQVLAMHGLGAAYLGLNLAKLAYEPLNRAYKNTPETPSLTTNWCLANYLLDQQRPESLRALESALQQEATETGVDLMEAMTTKWGRALTPDAKTRLEAARTRAMKRLEAQHPKQKRWGDVWIPAEEYDERLQNEVLITALSQQISVLNQEVRRAEIVYRTALDRNRDVKETKTRLDEWKKNLADAEKVLEVTRAKVPERAAEQGIKPIIPEVPPGVLLREE